MCLCTWLAFCVRPLVVLLGANPIQPVLWYSRLIILADGRLVSSVFRGTCDNEDASVIMQRKGGLIGITRYPDAIVFGLGRPTSSRRLLRKRPWMEMGVAV